MLTNEEKWEQVRARHAAKMAANPPAPPIVCPHRGAVLRLADCDSCRGRVLVKIYACSLHGECVIGKGPSGVHRCDG